MQAYEHSTEPNFSLFFSLYSLLSLWFLFVLTRMLSRAAPASSSSGLSSDGIDDVEELLLDTSANVSKEKQSHLQELVRCGNNAFREHRFEQAINYYTRANNIKWGDPVILSNRSSCYIRYAQFLKNRSSSTSEFRPMNGLDPTKHAGLALKDAEKVISQRPDSAKSYILKANALILLEKYDLARDVIISGLQINPSSNLLLNLERLIAKMTGRRNLGITLPIDDFDCPLCLKLLYGPVTTPCGHSFCRSCLFQSMDRSNNCPLCRTVLFISPGTCTSSATLKSIIQKNFPKEYAERMSEHESLANPGMNLLPLLVKDLALPCQRFHLNVFEPRYRLMVRRSMEGNRRMGMVVMDSMTGYIADYGCEIEIVDCEPVPDGSFFLEVESRRRCRIISNWDQDGYRVGKVEWVQDSYPPEGTPERNELQQIVTGAAEYARQWLREALVAAEGDRVRHAELLKAEGLNPSTQDPECFSFWLATLTNRRLSEKLELLRLSDTKERIRRALIYMVADELRRRLRRS